MMYTRILFILALFTLNACVINSPGGIIRGGSGCGADNSDHAVQCRIKQKLKPVASKAALENNIRQALNNNELETVKAHVALADRLYIAVDQQLRETYYQRLNQQGETMTASYSAKELMTLTNQLISGKSINIVEFGLSVMGFAAGASEYLLPQKMVEPTRVGVSVLQQGLRNREISSNFYTLIKQVFSEAINPTGIKQSWANSSWTDKLSDPYTSLLAQNLDLDKFSSLFLPIYRMQQNTSLGGAVLMLKYVNDLESFKKVEQLTRIFKDGAPAVLDFLGTGAYQ
ncbi:hypothetical protein QUF61_14795 [Candidatus Venteria ishoeyi]|uniref:hypothetical protein n=1 Tax=Candidatus Venteria ishoeyi TaxID=1899563 RepID=UPI0025A658FB|nr:hypothetical protein [Candidatus Venteria ishoeyi]MDM8547757.1 hypothetical protein [Candidatus Venteria ishoeyi]